MKQTMSLYAIADNFFIHWYSILYRFTYQVYLLNKYKTKTHRYLELGPGDIRIPNFETLNLVKNKLTDFVGDICGKLPFSANTFDIIYVSHALEHVPWYKVDEVILEWKRILKPNGTLEIWVPDGLKIAQAFVDAEKTGSDEWKKDNWFRFNEKQDPSVWFSARMFSYGDGTGTRGHRNWHLSTYSPRLLQEILERNGFSNVTLMENKKCRGFDHGWINLGMKANK